MQRRSPPAESARAALLAAALLLGSPCLASAEGVSGSVDAAARLSPQGRHGAGVSADALWGGDTVRGGFTLGIDAVRRGDGETSAVFTPVGAALSLRLFAGSSGAAFLGARAGAGLGAQQGGFVVGPFASGLTGYAFRLGEAASIRLGFELLGIWTSSRRETWLSPFVGLGF